MNINGIFFIIRLPMQGSKVNDFAIKSSSEDKAFPLDISKKNTKPVVTEIHEFEYWDNWKKTLIRRFRQLGFLWKSDCDRFFNRISRCMCKPFIWPLGEKKPTYSYVKNWTLKIRFFCNFQTIKILMRGLKWRTFQKEINITSVEFSIETLVTEIRLLLRFSKMSLNLEIHQTKQQYSLFMDYQNAEQGNRMTCT